MQIISDLHLHSRFARAVSKEMTLPNIALWARRKGIDLIATGDFTHPMWFREIEKDLVESGNGFFTLRQDKTDNTKPLFLLSTEISCIYSQNGKGRRVHTLVWVPSLDSAGKINKEMTKRGCNLLSDGRPIIGLTSIELSELILTIEPKALIIPAHIWTPWFSMYGFMSGFESVDEAFGPFAKHIYAVETGLSSSPDMNWRIKELDSRAIVSFSDAHSGPKLGREATVFETGIGLSGFSYSHIYDAISHHMKADTQGMKAKVAYTIEFFPEEGKYHYTGHRTCNIRYGLEEVRKKGTTCPVCGKPLTQGVMQRVEELSGRSEEELQISSMSYKLSDKGEVVKMTKSNAFPDRPLFVSLVPLQEIISECIGSPVASTKTQAIYTKLTDTFGSEFTVLLSASKEEISREGGDRIAAGIMKVRAGDIVVDPGYDGVFGVVKIWKEGEEKPLVDKSKEQLGLF